ncbi:MAG: thiol-disulfide isomerase [Actinobacteria bacterium]|jgi:methylamine dehydrogenase accessory protein MauD|nr:thiol-disulfide isomerase [Actinomycetota bacterium]
MSGWWAVSYVVLWCLVAALTVVVVALARQVGTLHMRLAPSGAFENDDEGPPIGQAPPPYAAVDTQGNHVTIGGPAEPKFLLFISPGCRVCSEVAPGLKAAARAGSLAPFLIVEGEPGTGGNGRDMSRYGSPTIHSTDLSASYGIPGTPFAVILDSVGVVRAKGTVNNLEQMEGLVDTARRRIDGEEGTHAGANHRTS